MRSIQTFRMSLALMILMFGSVSSQAQPNIASVTNYRGHTTQQRQKANPAEQSEVSFSLTRLSENPNQYSLVMSDSNERVVSENFSIDQLQVLRAIMVEAEKFARTGEAAGTKEAVTTRFADKHETAFIVDVQKLGAESWLFLTLNTAIGQMTSESGHINRNVGHDSGLFFDLLSRLESVLPKLPAKPAK